MEESSFVTANVLYHLGNDALSAYSFDAPDTRSCESVEGKAFVSNGMLYKLQNSTLESKKVGEKHFSAILEEVPTATEYIHFHNSDVFFLTRDRVGCGVLHNDKSIFASEGVEQYWFEHTNFYFLSLGVVKKLDLIAHTIVEATEHKKITSFAVRDGVVAVGLKSGRIHIRDADFHWHSSAIKAMRLSFSGNEVYSVSSKNVLHKYSVPSQRSQVLFEFVGPFKSIDVAGEFLVLETEVCLVAYNLKYEKVMGKFYTLGSVQRSVALERSTDSRILLTDVLDVVEDPIGQELTDSVVALRSGRVVLFIDNLRMRFLKVFCAGVDVKDFFSDRSFLYVLTPESLLVYAICEKDFALIACIKLGTHIGSMTKAVFRDGEVRLLIEGSIYRLNSNSGFLTNMDISANNMFVTGEKVYTIDDRGIAGPSGYVLIESGITAVTVGSSIYIGTQNGIVVAEPDEWKVVQKIDLGDLRGFLVIDDVILALCAEGTARKVVRLEQSGDLFAEVSCNGVSETIDALISEEYGADAQGNVLYIGKARAW